MGMGVQDTHLNPLIAMTPTLTPTVLPLPGPCAAATAVVSNTEPRPAGTCTSAFSSVLGAKQGATRAGKSRKTPEQRKEAAVLRRQRNRKKDDAVICPLCLQQPWTYGRLCNCKDHIKSGRCDIQRLEQIITNRATDVPMAAIWRKDNGHFVIARLQQGDGKRSARLYWTPTCYVSEKTAMCQWMALGLQYSTENIIEDKIKAADILKDHPLWEPRDAAPMPVATETNIIPEDNNVEQFLVNEGAHLVECASQDWIPTVPSQSTNSDLAVWEDLLDFDVQKNYEKADLEVPSLDVDSDLSFLDMEASDLSELHVGSFATTVFEGFPLRLDDHVQILSSYETNFDFECFENTEFTFGVCSAAF
jgi:hypothetical protein